MKIYSVRALIEDKLEVFVSAATSPDKAAMIVRETVRVTRGIEQITIVQTICLSDMVEHIKNPIVLVNQAAL